MLSIFIVFWNILLATNPTSQANIRYSSPLDGYTLQMHSGNIISNTWNNLVENTPTDSDDSDDSEDTDDETKEAANLNKNQHVSPTTHILEKLKSIFEYLDQLSQAHKAPIKTPPDM